MVSVPGDHFGLQFETNLAVFVVCVCVFFFFFFFFFFFINNNANTSVLSTNFRVSWTCRSEEEVKKIFLRW